MKIMVKRSFQRHSASVCKLENNKIINKLYYVHLVPVSTIKPSKFHIQKKKIQIANESCKQTKLTLSCSCCFDLSQHCSKIALSSSILVFKFCCSIFLSLINVVRKKQIFYSKPQCSRTKIV